MNRKTETKERKISNTIALTESQWETIDKKSNELKKSRGTFLWETITGKLPLLKIEKEKKK